MQSSKSIARGSNNVNIYASSQVARNPPQSQISHGGRRCKITIKLAISMRFLDRSVLLFQQYIFLDNFYMLMASVFLNNMHRKSRKFSKPANMFSPYRLKGDLLESCLHNNYMFIHGSRVTLKGGRVPQKSGKIRESSRVKNSLLWQFYKQVSPKIKKIQALPYMPSCIITSV
jgi:hypothetical protein